MAPRIQDLWASALPCHRADSLASAVSTAKQLAQKEDVVLFSPGTSSFDMFKNYADRGNQFRALVQQFS
jgi:UDP-N-acetylmuramoylalanine--D-glutamate ligase